jgi:hypothetical protein
MVAGRMRHAWCTPAPFMGGLGGVLQRCEVQCPRVKPEGDGRWVMRLR